MWVLWLYGLRFLLRSDHFILIFLFSITCLFIYNCFKTCKTFFWVKGLCTWLISYRSFVFTQNISALGFLRCDTLTFTFLLLQPVETCGYREITMFDEALRHQTVVRELAATKRFHKPQKRPRSTVVCSKGILQSHFMLISYEGPQVSQT